MTPPSCENPSWVGMRLGQILGRQSQDSWFCPTQPRAAETHEWRDGKDVTKYSHCDPGVESRALAEAALWGEGACGKLS